MSRFYALGYTGVMEMPIRAFWVFNRNIDRIVATDRLNSLEVANAAQSGEGAKELSERLTLVIGEVVDAEVTVEPLDRSGLEELRAMK